jgi:3'-5' exonuclease
MGFNDENAGRIVIDVETVACPDAAKYLDPVEAPSNYKDPLKIAAYVADTFRKRVEDAGLEPDLNEIVAVGVSCEGITAVATRAHLDERGLLEMAWDNIGNRAIVGFNCLGFDLPVLIRRSQLLGVPYPNLNLDRYRTPHVDLLEKLTFNGKLTYRTLGFYLRRFGLPHDDTVTGADIAGLVAEGRWDAVASHCRHDVEGTAALARRLGWLPQIAAESAVA